jgi:hypothetical protein
MLNTCIVDFYAWLMVRKRFADETYVDTAALWHELMIQGLTVALNWPLS